MVRICVALTVVTLSPIKDVVRKLGLVMMTDAVDPTVQLLTKKSEPIPCLILLATLAEHTRYAITIPMSRSY